MTRYLPSTLALLLCAAASLSAQVNRNDPTGGTSLDSLLNDTATVSPTAPPVQRTAPPATPARRRPVDPQLGEKLGRIDADLRGTTDPAERNRLLAERARLLEQSTGEEMVIQTGVAPAATTTEATMRDVQPDEFDGIGETRSPEVEVVPLDQTDINNSGRHTALPSRTSRVRTAETTPATTRSTARAASRPTARTTAATRRTTPSRTAPRATDRPAAVRQSGGSEVERAAAMARRGQRTEARRALIDILRRNPRSPAAVEARKLLQTL